MFEEGTKVIATETCEEIIGVVTGTPGTITEVDDFDKDFPYLVEFGEEYGAEWCGASYITAVEEGK